MITAGSQSIIDQVHAELADLLSPKKMQEIRDLAEQLAAEGDRDGCDACCELYWAMEDLAFAFLAHRAGLEGTGD